MEMLDDTVVLFFNLLKIKMSQRKWSWPKGFTLKEYPAIFHDTEDAKSMMLKSDSALERSITIQLRVERCFFHAGFKFHNAKKGKWNKEVKV